MSLKAVNITKGKIGANASGPGTAVSGLIANGIAIMDTLEYGTSYKLLSVDDAEGLGIDADYDSDNQVNVYRHIQEFYRMAGEGVPLWIMIVQQNVTMEEMLGINDDPVYAQKLIIDANGEIRQLAVAFNPAANTYQDANTDGLNNDVYSAILVAQSWYEWTYNTFRPCHVLIEGRAMNGAAVSCLNLRAIDNDGEPYQFDKVSLVIGQDYDYADGLWNVGKKFADVGNVLGILSFIAMNQNIGEVGTLNISDAIKGKFNSAGISSHTKVEDVESQWETFDQKGYILPVKYTGISGYRWNNDHVCAPIIIDADKKMNEHYISLGRTVNEVVRTLRTVLLPEVKKTHPVDAATGKLPTGVIKYFTGIGNDVMKEYKADGFISDGETTTDPDSNLLEGDRALNVSFVVVPTGIVGIINGEINLKTSL